MFAEIGATPAGPTANSCGNHEVDPYPLRAVPHAGLRASREGGLLHDFGEFGVVRQHVWINREVSIGRERLYGDVGQTNFTNVEVDRLSPNEDDGTPVLIQRRQGIQKDPSREDELFLNCARHSRSPSSREVGLRPQKDHDQG